MKNQQNKGQASKGRELTEAQNDFALVELERLANRQGFRACQSLRSGKPTGKGRGWRMPVEVSKTSEVEAKLAGKYEVIRALHHAYGEAWPARAQWLPAFGPFTRRQIAFKRWLSLTAWRGAFNDVTQLPGGVTGRRSSGVRALFVSIDDENKEEAANMAAALFAPDSEGNPWLEASEAKEAKRASDIKRAKVEVFKRCLEPFKGYSMLKANDRRAKWAAIRRGRVIGYLLDGQRAGMMSNNLKRLLKPLGLPLGRARAVQGTRSLVSQLASLK